jgi:hypothetical protein
MAVRGKKEVPIDVLDTTLESKRARVTLILSQAIDRNIELLAMIKGEKKTEIVQNALRDYLKKRGVKDPDLDPHHDVRELLLAK